MNNECPAPSRTGFTITRRLVDEVLLQQGHGQVGAAEHRDVLARPFLQLADGQDGR
jgi:hypothetical protein